MFVKVQGGKRQKAEDLICWNCLEGRRCVKHAELATTRGYQAVIVPIHSNDITTSTTSRVDATKETGSVALAAESEPSSGAEVLAYAHQLVGQLKSAGLAALLDASTHLNPGAKFYKWERLGAPLRLEVGQAEFVTGTVTVSINPGLVPGLLAVARQSSNSSTQHSNINRCLHASTAGSHVSSLLEKLLPSLRDTGAEGQLHSSPVAATAVAKSTTELPPSSLWCTGNAVYAAGIAPVKLTGIAAAEAADVCNALITQAAAAAHEAQQTFLQGDEQQQVWPSLLPFGCCSKLHLWPDCTAANRPCVDHIHHLINIGRPCRCGNDHRHISRSDLQAEIQRQLAAVSCEVQTVKFSIQQKLKHSKDTVVQCAEDPGSHPTAVDSTQAVALFVTGLPANRPTASVKLQLQQKLEGFGVVSVAVSTVGQGRRCRGWAKLLLQDEAAAQHVLQTFEHGLELYSNQPPATLSWCCGRADALFPQLPYALRRQLRLDSVAAYSTTDGPTASAMAALLAAVAARVQQQGVGCDSSTSCGSGAGPADCNSASTHTGAPAQQITFEQQEQLQKLSVADLTACAGGNVIAFMQQFRTVTAVELDPDRAEDLLHNVQLVLEQQQQLLTAPAAQQGLAFDMQAMPHMAVLCKTQQSYGSSKPLARSLPLQHQQQACCQTVAVLCGDAVQLLPELQFQDVIFLDPPWGGPNYNQCRPEQQSQQQQLTGLQTSDADQHKRGADETLDNLQWHHQASTHTVHKSVQMQQPINSSTLTTTTTVQHGAGASACYQLGGMALSDLCVQLCSKCAVLAVKLPRRGCDLDQFCHQVLIGMQKQQVEKHAFVAAVRTHFGRSELVLFIQQAVRGLEQQCHSDFHSRQQEPMQQNVLSWLRPLLQAHQQHSAKITY